MRPGAAYPFVSHLRCATPDTSKEGETMTHHHRQIARTRLLLVFCLPWLVACAQVQPWERGNLAKPQMAIDPQPMQSTLSSHVHNSREGTVSGGAGEGGGCGCY